MQVFGAVILQALFNERQSSYTILAGMIESVLTRDSPKDKLLGAVFAGVAGFSGMIFLVDIAPW